MDHHISPRALRRHCGYALALLLTCASMSASAQGRLLEPSQRIIVNYNEAVTFSGVVDAPVPVFLSVREGGGPWAGVAEFDPSNEPNSDGTYNWSGRHTFGVTFPEDAPEVRTFSDGTSVNVLTLRFDSNELGKLKAGQGDEISIYVACGKTNQTCCGAASSCLAGLHCNFDRLICEGHLQANAPPIPPTGSTPPAPSSPSPGIPPPPNNDLVCVRVHATACYDDFGHLLEPPSPSCVDQCASDVSSAAEIARSYMPPECEGNDQSCCDTHTDSDTSWCGY